MGFETSSLEANVSPLGACSTNRGFGALTKIKVKAYWPVLAISPASWIAFWCSIGAKTFAAFALAFATSFIGVLCRIWLREIALGRIMFTCMCFGQRQKMEGCVVVLQCIFQCVVKWSDIRMTCANVTAWNEGGGSSDK